MASGWNEPFIVAAGTALTTSDLTKATSAEQDAALANAPDPSGDFFRVPRIIEE